MRTRFPLIVVVVGLLAGLSTPQAFADLVTVDFEDKSLPPDSFYNGSDGAGGFTSRGAFFNNSYNATFAVWSGWSYSNINDTSPPAMPNLDYLKQYDAITGTGVGGSGIYGVAFNFSPGDAYINLPAGSSPLS